MKIGFYFEPSDLKRWFRAVRNLKKEALLAEKQLPFKGATEYRNMVLSNLTHQRFGWQRLSPQYAEWKKEHGYPAKHWMMRGELIAAVKVFRAKGIRNKDGWAGGVDPNAYAPHIGWSNMPRGNIKIVKYALWNEEGTRKQPARPLFMPTAWGYAAHKWPVLAATYHKRFGSKWR
jgi:hypothetical protein